MLLVARRLLRVGCRTAVGLRRRTSHWKFPRLVRQSKGRPGYEARPGSARRARSDLVLIARVLHGEAVGRHVVAVDDEAVLYATFARHDEMWRLPPGAAARRASSAWSARQSHKLSRMTWLAATSIITFVRTFKDPGPPTRAKTSLRTDGSDLRTVSAPAQQRRVHARRHLARLKHEDDRRRRMPPASSAMTQAAPDAGATSVA